MGIVYELAGDDSSLFYDDERYLVTVDINLDEYGNLSISTPKYIGETQQEVREILFVNKDMISTSLILMANKTVNDLAPTDSQKFNFQLIDADTGKVVETVQNAKGEIRFAKMHFAAKGIYNYIVKEVIPERSEEGFTYDKTEFKIQVVVTDADNDGVLEKKVTVNEKETSAKDDTVSVGTFENAYVAKQPGNTPLTGDKMIPIVYVMGMIIALGAMAVWVKRREKIVVD